VNLFAEYTDPRLVPLYDTVCPFAADTIFYLEFAVTLNASVIVDVGCGTGRLTTELARRGHRVIGVDPSPAMLEIARRRPGGEQVGWVEGDASQIDVAGVDLVIMTGHVAQVIADETEWANTLDAGQTSPASGRSPHFRDSRSRRAAVGGRKGLCPPPPVRRPRGAAILHVAGVRRA
jgi:SAM-dependent methyltransferase